MVNNKRSKQDEKHFCELPLGPMFVRDDSIVSRFEVVPSSDSLFFKLLLSIRYKSRLRNEKLHAKEADTVFESGTEFKSSIAHSRK